MMIVIILVAVAAAFAAGFAVAWVARSASLRVALERRADAERWLAEQRADFEKLVAGLQATFRGLSAEVLKESREEFLREAQPAILQQVAPLQDALKRYDEALRDIEGKRGEAYGGLKRQVELLQGFAQELKDETGNLKNALKSTTARGRWGEVTLRRVVELAGMSEYCDFEEQAQALGEAGRMRPDMVVRIPGGRSVVVDAKAPLDAYQRAVEATSEADRRRYLGEHADAVRERMRQLSQRAYWEQFDSATDLVVMFLPGESFATAALEADRTLLEDGMRSRVLIATPTTLVALLRSFAMGWQQERLARGAEEISSAGKELFERIVKFASHFERVGKGLRGALDAFNDGVGSFERMLVPGARRLAELGATKSPDAESPSVERIEVLPRPLASPDFPAEG